MSIDPSAIKLEETDSKGRYTYASSDGEAEMTFSKAGENLIIIDYTGVPDSMRGQGVGQALVARGVADARTAGKKIMPLCPFAAKEFRAHPDWADVLNK